MSKDEPSEPFTRVRKLVLGGFGVAPGRSREGKYSVERRERHPGGEDQQVDGHLEAQVVPGQLRGSTGVLPPGRRQPERGVMWGFVDWLVASKLRMRVAVLVVKALTVCCWAYVMWKLLS